MASFWLQLTSRAEAGCRNRLRWRAKCRGLVGGLSGSAGEGVRVAAPGGGWGMLTSDAISTKA